MPLEEMVFGEEISRQEDEASGWIVAHSRKKQRQDFTPGDSLGPSAAFAFNEAPTKRRELSPDCGATVANADVSSAADEEIDDTDTVFFLALLRKAAGTSGSLSRASSQPSSRINRAERGAASVARDLAAASLSAETDRNGLTGFGQQRNLGEKRNPDHCLEFLERRLALEAETREREAALEDRRLAIEERRLALQESQLQLDIAMHLQRVREFEEAHETRRQERAMLSQQNELLANVLRALVEKLTK
ncbi:hypothetical protein MRX96_045652 [Rhipicephalus microplus]